MRRGPRRGGARLVSPAAQPTRSSRSRAKRVVSGPGDRLGDRPVPRALEPARGSAKVHAPSPLRKRRHSRTARRNHPTGTAPRLIKTSLAPGGQPIHELRPHRPAGSLWPSSSLTAPSKLCGNQVGEPIWLRCLTQGSLRFPTFRPARSDRVTELQFTSSKGEPAHRSCSCMVAALTIAAGTRSLPRSPPTSPSTRAIGAAAVPRAIAEATTRFFARAKTSSQW